MPQGSPSLLDELLRASPKLDQVIGELTGGRPSQPGYDGHADQVVGIAEDLIRAARGPGRTRFTSR